MKRLLLQNSLFLLFAILVLAGCKTKKKLVAQTATETEQVEEREKEDIVVEDAVQERIIHAPGTINPGALDSIKAARMKEKLNYKK